MRCVELYWCSVNIYIYFCILCGYFRLPCFPSPITNFGTLVMSSSHSPSVFFLVWVGPTVSPLSSFSIRSVSPLNLATFVHELRDYPNPRRDYVLTGIRDGFHIGFIPARVTLRPSHRNLKSAFERPGVIDKYLSTELETIGLLVLIWSLLFRPFTPVRLGSFRNATSRASGASF